MSQYASFFSCLVVSSLNARTLRADPNPLSVQRPRRNRRRHLAQLYALFPPPPPSHPYHLCPARPDLPDGNSKFSTFEVDTRVANQPVVRVRVIIDGVEAWAVDVQGKALEIPPPPSTVGSLGKSLMELLGFKVRFELSSLKGEFWVGEGG